jgi:hypothetical protein
VLSVRYGENFKLICKQTSSVKGLKLHLSVIPRRVIKLEGFTTMFISIRSESDESNPQSHILFKQIQERQGDTSLCSSAYAR